MAPFHLAHPLTHSLARLVQDLDELESEAYDVEQKLRTIERIYRTQPSLLKPGAVSGLAPTPTSTQAPNPNPNCTPQPSPGAWADTATRCVRHAR